MQKRLQGWMPPPQTHTYELLEQPPHNVFKRGRECRVDSMRFPISTTVTGVILDLEPGGVALLALACHRAGGPAWHSFRVAAREVIGGCLFPGDLVVLANRLAMPSLKFVETPALK